VANGLVLVELQHQMGKSAFFAFFSQSRRHVGGLRCYDSEKVELNRCIDFIHCSLKHGCDCGGGLGAIWRYSGTTYMGAVLVIGGGTVTKVGHFRLVQILYFASGHMDDCQKAYTWAMSMHQSWGFCPFGLREIWPPPKLDK
jgi:hypothetical protein